MERTRTIKRSGLVKNPALACQCYLRALDEFRRRMRRTKFTKVTPFIDYLGIPVRKKDFLSFIDELEDFRCNVLGMNEEMFYRLVAEFILVPNGVKYYNPLHIFGCKGSFEAEEFRERIFETLVQISDATGVGNEDEVYDFINNVNKLNNLVDLNGASHVFRLKDWFCIKASIMLIKRKGWTIEETIGKIKVFYRHRIRKVYPEMLIMDLVRKELDQIQFNNQNKKKLPKHIEVIKSSDWYKDWESRLGED